jgi:chromosome segregation ATPase
MDERRKTIRELEDKKRANQESINLMLADLGEILLSRIGGEEVPAGGSLEFPLAEYRRLLGEIAGSEELIRRIEEDTARLRKLEEEIQRKEQQSSGYLRDISAAHIKLGELLLEDPQFEDFASGYSQQAGALISKIRSLEERLESFEGKNGANVFAWIGKSAQTMVLSSFLAKTQDNLRRLYASAGEKFFQTRSAEARGRGEAGALIAEIDDQRKLSTELSSELVLLRGERRKIGESFGSEGSPVKQIQGQEKHIRHVREELRSLYLVFGEKAADLRLRNEFKPLLEPGDLAILERAGEIREIIDNIEDQIEKLKASLAIDDEKAEIEKLRGSIGEHRQRIAAGEKAIAGLEARIAESDRRIEELNRFLEGDD